MTLRTRLARLPILAGLAVAIVVPWPSALVALLAGVGAWLVGGVLLAVADSLVGWHRARAERRHGVQWVRFVPVSADRRHPAA
ncbi:MAG: hypothetical protein ACRDYZ_11870 [Acidimicrobiales bacterium]